MPGLQINRVGAVCGNVLATVPLVTEHVLPMPMHRLAPNGNSVGEIHYPSLMRLPGVQVRAKHREDFRPSVTLQSTLCCALASTVIPATPKQDTDSIKSSTKVCLVNPIHTVSY